MNILVIEETDWLTRGPHGQHHIFERLSLNPKNNITVFDYDIEHQDKGKGFIVKKKVFRNHSTVIENSRVKIIRSALIKVPYIRRISSLIWNFFNIGQEIKENRPDIIITYSISNGVIGYLYSKLYDIPFIFHYIDILHELVPSSLSYIKKYARIIGNLLLKHSDKVIVLNETHQKYVINEGIKANKILIIKTGVSLENTRYNNSKIKMLKEKFDFSEDDFIIFFMGYLYDFAGLIEIIDYYNKNDLAKRYKIKFLIIGNKGIENQLRNHIQKVRANWVVYAGRIPYNEIANYIEISDLGLLSFKINDVTREISPIKIYEYMAQKKPALSTKLPGIYNEIGENNGVIYAKNQKELIERIKDLSGKKEELQKIGLKGYNYIKKNLLWEDIVMDFNIILRNIIRNQQSKKYNIINGIIPDNLDIKERSNFDNLKQKNFLYVSQQRFSSIDKIPGKFFHEAKFWAKYFKLVIFVGHSDNDEFIYGRKGNFLIFGVPFKLSNTTLDSVLHIFINYFRLTYLLLRIIKIFKIDLIREGNLILVGLPSLVASKFTKTPFFCWLGGFERKAFELQYKGSKLSKLIQKLIIILESLIFRNSNMNITVSKELYELIKERKGKNRFLSPNFVDFSIFTKKINHFPNSDKIKLLYSGRLEPEKGLDNLLKAILILSRRISNFELNIIGYGSMKPLIKKFIRAYNLTDKVHLLGKYQLEHLPKFYHETDIFILSSYTEGLPAALLEAMATGCAIISTDVGMISKYIHHNKNGFLVPSNNPKALAAKIEKLISHPELITLFGDEARKTVDKKGDYIKINSKIYSSIMKAYSKSNSK